MSPTPYWEEIAQGIGMDLDNPINDEIMLRQSTNEDCYINTVLSMWTPGGIVSAGNYCILDHNSELERVTGLWMSLDVLVGQSLGECHMRATRETDVTWLTTTAAELLQIASSEPTGEAVLQQINRLVSYGMF